jgi:hypothetical protein
MPAIPTQESTDIDTLRAFLSSLLKNKGLDIDISKTAELVDRTKTERGHTAYLINSIWKVASCQWLLASPQKAH